MKPQKPVAKEMGGQSFKQMAKAAREALGLSQEEVALRMGTFQAVVKNYENGEFKPSTPEAVTRYAVALELTEENKETFIKKWEDAKLENVAEKHKDLVKAAKKILANVSEHSFEEIAKSAREALGLSQEKVAFKIRKTVSQIINYEAGDDRPESIEKYANALGLKGKVREIFKGKWQEAVEKKIAEETIARTSELQSAASEILAHADNYRFGEVLKAYRTIKQLSSTELGAVLGTSKVFINRNENNPELDRTFASSTTRDILNKIPENEIRSEFQAAYQKHMQLAFQKDIDAAKTALDIINNAQYFLKYFDDQTESILQGNKEVIKAAEERFEKKDYPEDIVKIISLLAISPKHIGEIEKLYDAAFSKLLESKDPGEIFSGYLDLNAIAPTRLFKETMIDNMQIKALREGRLGEVTLYTFTRLNECVEHKGMHSRLNDIYRKHRESIIDITIENGNAGQIMEAYMERERLTSEQVYKSIGMKHRFFKMFLDNDLDNITGDFLNRILSQVNDKKIRNAIEDKYNEHWHAKLDAILQKEGSVEEIITTFLAFKGQAAMVFYQKAGVAATALTALREEKWEEISPPTFEKILNHVDIKKVRETIQEKYSLSQEQQKQEQQEQSKIKLEEAIRNNASVKEIMTHYLGVRGLNQEKFSTSADIGKGSLSLLIEERFGDLSQPVFDKIMSQVKIPDVKNAIKSQYVAYQTAISKEQDEVLKPKLNAALEEGSVKEIMLTYLALKRQSRTDLYKAAGTTDLPLRFLLEEKWAEITPYTFEKIMDQVDVPEVKQKVKEKYNAYREEQRKDLGGKLSESLKEGSVAEVMLNYLEFKGMAPTSFSKAAKISDLTLNALLDGKASELAHGSFIRIVQNIDIPEVRNAIEEKYNAERIERLGPKLSESLKEGSIAEIMLNYLEFKNLTRSEFYTLAGVANTTLNSLLEGKTDEVSELSFTRITRQIDIPEVKNVIEAKYNSHYKKLDVSSLSDEEKHDLERKNETLRASLQNKNVMEFIQSYLTLDKVQKNAKTRHHNIDKVIVFVSESLGSLSEDEKKFISENPMIKHYLNLQCMPGSKSEVAQAVGSPEDEQVFNNIYDNISKQLNEQHEKGRALGAVISGHKLDARIKGDESGHLAFSGRDIKFMTRLLGIVPKIHHNWSGSEHTLAIRIGVQKENPEFQNLMQIIKNQIESKHEAVIAGEPLDAMKCRLPNGAHLSFSAEDREKLKEYLQKKGVVLQQSTEVGKFINRTNIGGQSINN